MTRETYLAFRMKATALVLLLVAGYIAQSSQPVHAAAQSTDIAIIGSPGVINGGSLPTSGADLPGMTFTNLSPATVTAATLSSFDTVILNVASSEMSCTTGTLSAAAKADLVAFVGGGGKLIIYDSECAAADYSWLPFPFTTSNPGAFGANGALTIVEDNTLSSTDAASPFFIDAAAIGSQTDAVGDGNVFTTFDPNWCLDMSATNVLNVTGPIHTYAKFPAATDKGLIIYNGLDVDVLPSSPGASGAGQLRKVYALELLQPFNPSNLPCGISAVGITLAPGSASNPVGTTHTVTATLKDQLGTAQPGVLVTFSVETGPNAAATGTCNPATCLSDSNGQVTFTYTGSGGPGTDEIIACFTSGTPPTEQCSQTVTKEWTTGPNQPVPLTDFRDVRRPTQINVGPDLCGTGQESINFTGRAGSSGDTWITVYDPLPRPPADTFGSVSLAADVLIKRFDNAKGAGLLALFNEAAGKKGLALIPINNGNTDRLQLVTVDQAGKRTVLTSVSLGSAIQQCVWYRVTMNVVVSGADVTVTGQVFQHASPTDPDTAVTGQVGPTLSFTGPRPAGVDATGEVGIIAAATSAVVDSSVTNFSQPQ